MPRGKRNPRLIEELAIECARGGSIRAWAQTNGVPEKTCYCWSGKPEFKGRVERHRREITQRAIGKLASKAVWAITELIKLAKGAQSESVRLGALREINEQWLRTSSYAELERRTAMIEAYIEQQKGGNHGSGTELEIEDQDR